MRIRIRSRNERAVVHPIEKISSFQGWGSLLGSMTQQLFSSVSNSLGKLHSKLRNESKGNMFAIKDVIRQQSALQVDVKLPLKKELSRPIADHSLNLSEKQKARLQEIQSRRRELMERLRQIDSEITNEYDASRIMRSKISLKDSFAQISPQKLPKDDYDPLKHSKAIEMVARLNEQKSQRQEKLMQRIKKKEKKELQRIHASPSANSSEAVSKQSTTSKNSLVTDFICAKTEGQGMEMKAQVNSLFEAEAGQPPEGADLEPENDQV